jgi:hypothetical protein
MTAFSPGQSPPPVRIPTRMVLLLLECLVNHTALFTRRKSKEQAAHGGEQINLF